MRAAMRRLCLDIVRHLQEFASVTKWAFFYWRLRKHDLELPHAGASRVPAVERPACDAMLDPWTLTASSDEPTLRCYLFGLCFCGGDSLNGLWLAGDWAGVWREAFSWLPYRFLWITGVITSVAWSCCGRPWAIRAAVNFDRFVGHASFLLCGLKIASKTVGAANAYGQRMLRGLSAARTGPPRHRWTPSWPRHRRATGSLVAELD